MCCPQIALKILARLYGNLSDFLKPQFHLLLLIPYLHFFYIINKCLKYLFTNQLPYKKSLEKILQVLHEDAKLLRSFFTKSILHHTLHKINKFICTINKGSQYINCKYSNLSNPIYCSSNYRNCFL